MPACVEGQVRACRGSDDLRAPVEQLCVEGARPYLIGGVKLQVHDRPGRCLGLALISALISAGLKSHHAHPIRHSLSYSSCRRIQSCHASPSSRPFGARSRMG
jgi:hypothetical protein